MSGALGWWRHALLAGAVAGLLVAQTVTAPEGWLPCVVAAGFAAAAIGRTLLRDPLPSSSAAAGWLTCLVALGAIAGLGAGNARIAAIEDDAFAGRLTAEATATGHVAEVPRRSYGEVRFPLATAEGRLLVLAREPVGDLEVGGEVEVAGRITRPESPFARDEARRAGARLILEASELRPTGGARGGLPGILDRIRGRAEDALSEGMGAEQAALARGFVLGQDDLIDPHTREEFRRSGLAHLLAVSGQNVMLLAILAGVVMGVFGVGLRMRLALTMLLIAAYVPIAGGAPSIQRAGVMGAAAIVATLAGRPADRAYPALLAAAVTLLIDPTFGADVGWQLSFAAVVGIMLWASPLRELIAERLARRLPARVAAPVAEGLALTLAATVATAPLMAHHFEELSLASLPANLLVLPAVAPVMWVGMAIGLLAQVPFAPTAPLATVEGALVDYVAWVARLLAGPDWAQVGLPSPGAGAVAATYAAIALLALAALALGRRRRALSPPRALVLALSGVMLATLVAFAFEGGDGGAAGSAPGALSITALDVGQGDAILLRPPRGDPILVDGGPPGDAAAEALRDLGVDRLAAVFLTHDDLDHSGGLFAVLEAARVRRLVTAAPAPEIAAAARASGISVLRTSEGAAFRFGPLALDVLWPPRDDPPLPGEDPNLHSLVMRASFAGYDALLLGDAEAEATHLDPGPIDVLKVAHHGSDDAGLESLLDRSAPRLALIGVGADNTYGHPTDATIAALAERGVCVLRTDADGSVTVSLGAGGVSAWTSAGGLPPDRPGC